MGKEIPERPGLHAALLPSCEMEDGQCEREDQGNPGMEEGIQTGSDQARSCQNRKLRLVLENCRAS